MLFDLSEKQSLGEVELKDIPWAFEFSADSRFLFVATGGQTDPGMVMQYDIKTGQMIAVYEYVDEIPQSIAVSRDGKFLAACGSDNEDPLRIFRIVR